ncbi:MAG: DUF4384 domain-containing protein [bacterium]
MRKLTLLLSVVIVLVLESWLCAYPIDVSPRVQISVSGGVGAVFTPGDSPDIWMVPDDDCYVMVYEIDTQGYLRVLYPANPYQSCFVRGGRAYRLSRPGSIRYYVSGPPGVIYIHVLASPRPFRRIYWDGCDGYARLSVGISWDNFNTSLSCVLPPQVWGDPYVAMQTIDEFICPDIIEEGIVWADFVYFYVGHRVDYPRYLCYDCHGFGCPFDPYSDICVHFTINIVNPRPVFSTWSWWCTPKRIYCGPRYVCIERGPRYWDRSDRSPVYKWKSKMEPLHSVERSIRGEVVSVGGKQMEREVSVNPERVRSENRTRNEIYTREQARQRKLEEERATPSNHRSGRVSNRTGQSREVPIIKEIVEQFGKGENSRRGSDQKANTKDHQRDISSGEKEAVRSGINAVKNRVTTSVRTRGQRDSQTRRRGISR